MRVKSLVLALILLVVSSPAMAATVSWVLPTAYTNGNPILAVDQARTTVKIYTGNSSTGPFTLATTTAAGATSGAGPSPATGATKWYTITSNLDGQESAQYSPAVSLTIPFPVPVAPSGLTVSP